MHLQRTNAQDAQFVALVRQLDADLAERDGEDHAYYRTFNSIEGLPHVVLASINGEPVGCGAMKPFAERALEIKRMYVPAAFRRTGIASAVLKELEAWAMELGYARCVLETGLRQPEAIALYTSHGFAPMPAYGPYIGVANSRCFSKDLGASAAQRLR
ncbi:MAG: GNAT family N-acetyltransferase [Flavobacteriales bacterium]|nr:GNAT family N-acetyltransferase [Flavobacteriales bacterium]